MKSVNHILGCKTAECLDRLSLTASPIHEAESSCDVRESWRTPVSEAVKGVRPITHRIEQLRT